MAEKKLKLVFKRSDDKNFTFELPTPKEDLTFAQIKTACEKIIPVLATDSGLSVSKLDKAFYVTYTEQAIV